MRYYINIYVLFRGGAMEIGCDASPKNRCWYCIVDNFDGLPVEEVVSIFLHDWVVCIPFLEIDVNVVIDNFMCMNSRGLMMIL